MRRLTTGAAALLLAGCAGSQHAGNPYQEYYMDQDFSGVPVQPVPYSGPPIVLRSSGDYDRDVEGMYAQGYTLLGASQFMGDAPDPKLAVEQAERVKASHVLLYSRGGIAGGKATCPLNSVGQCDQTAEYYAPMTRNGFGAQIGDVPADIAAKIGKPGGVLVKAVRQGSPAAGAGLQPGDVILAIAGQAIAFNTYAAAVESAVGKPTAFSIWHNGAVTQKRIAIPASW